MFLCSILPSPGSADVLALKNELVLVCEIDFAALVHEVHALRTSLADCQTALAANDANIRQNARNMKAHAMEVSAVREDNNALRTEIKTLAEEMRGIRDDIAEFYEDDEDAGELDLRTTPNFFLSGVEGRGNDGLKAITRGPS